MTYPKYDSVRRGIIAILGPLRPHVSQITLEDIEARLIALYEESASPRAVLGEPLNELERLAAGALEWMAGEREDTGREIRPGEVVHRIACRELHAACTPERIAQLVALARAGMEDGARLDWMQREGDALGTPDYPRAFYAASGDVGNFTPVGDPDDGTPFRSVRDAIDSARAARAPAGPGGENA